MSESIMDDKKVKKAYGRRNRKKRKFIEKFENQEVEVSRPTLLPALQSAKQDIIVKEMKKVFKGKFTDRWLLWTKTNLLQEHPDYSSEDIEKELLECAKASQECTGKDLLPLISALNDPNIIPSTRVSCYFSIGMGSIGEYLKKGGEYHLILCSVPSLLSHPVLTISGLFNKIPVIIIKELSYAIAKIIKNHQQEVIGFKKVEGNPFHDLVKFIAHNIPDTFATWIPSWKENIDNVSTGSSADDIKESALAGDNLQKESSVSQDGLEEDLNNGSNIQEHSGRKLNKDGKEWKDSPVISEFIKKHPLIQQPHQDMVLQEIKRVFENKMTDRWLVMRRDKLLKNKVEYSPKEMKWTLYDMVLQKEEYAGREIIHLVLSLTDPELIKTRKTVYNYISVGVPAIIEYLKGGGEYHFITYCTQGMRVVCKRPQMLDLITNNTPLFPLSGLSDVISDLLFPTSWVILGFKKVKNNPFDELVKFVADKIPDELPWIASWKENIDNVKDEVVCEDDAEMCNSKDLPEKMDDKCTTNNVMQEIEGGQSQCDSVEPPLKKMKALDDGNDSNNSTPIKEQLLETLDLKLTIPHQQSVLQKINDYFRSRVTDRWLLWKKMLVNKEHPEYTTEDIEEALISALHKNKKYAGKDFKYLMKRMNDPSMIKSTMISQYLSIGFHNLNRHLKNGGDFHVILYGKANVMKTNQLHEAVLRNIPVCLVTGPPTLLEVIRSIVGDHGSYPVLGFKKMKDNPFYDLVKFLAYKVHDAQSSSISKWKQKIIHTRTDEGIEEIKENSISSDSKPFNVIERNLEEDYTEVSSFTQAIQPHHQTMILEEIKNTFSQKLTDKWLTIKSQKLQYQNPQLSIEDIEDNLFEIVIQKEEHIGQDLVELVLSIHNSTLITSKGEILNYLTTSADRICQYIIDGGSYHLILYCSQAYSSLSKNTTFQSVVANVPVCLVSGLTELISQFIFIKPPAVIGFKNVKDCPFIELMKSVADTIPDENFPWIKLWKENICGEWKESGEFCKEGVISGNMSVSTMDY